LESFCKIKLFKRLRASQNIQQHCLYHKYPFFSSNKLTTNQFIQNYTNFSKFEFDAQQSIKWASFTKTSQITSKIANFDGIDATNKILDKQTKPTPTSEKPSISQTQWIQKYPLKKIYSCRKKINEFIVDEAVIKIGSEPTWLWVAIDSKNKRILAQSISKERNMFVAERFLSKAIEEYVKHPVSTDSGTWYPPQACRFLKLPHHLHSSFEKSIIERTMQFIKYRTENFDDYFPYRKKNCKLNHVNKWLNLFAHHYNKGISV